MPDYWSTRFDSYHNYRYDADAYTTRKSQADPDQEGAKPQAQSGSKPARAPKIKKEHSRIDWSAYTAKQLHARHRAFGHQVRIFS